MDMEAQMVGGEHRDLAPDPPPALHLALALAPQDDADPPPPTPSPPSSAARHSFPRFDPGMSEMIGQGDEISELIGGFAADPSEVTPALKLGGGPLDDYSFRPLRRSDDSATAPFDGFARSTAFSAPQDAPGASGLRVRSAGMEELLRGDAARTRSYLPPDDGSKKNSGLYDLNPVKASNLLHNGTRRSVASPHMRNSPEEQKFGEESSLHRRILGHRASNDCVLVGRSSGSTPANERRSFGSSLINERPRSSLMNVRRSLGSSRRFSESSERRFAESSLLSDRGSLRSSLLDSRGSSASSSADERQLLEDSLIDELQSLKSSLMKKRHSTEATLMDKRRLSGSSLLKEQRLSGSSSLMNGPPSGECSDPTSLLLQSTGTTQRVTQRTDIPLESLSGSTGLGATNDDYVDDGDRDGSLFDRGRSSNSSSPLHWRTARTRLSSILTRAQSHPLALNAEPRMRSGIQRSSRISTNEESAASQLARQPFDDHVATLSQLDALKKEVKVKENADGNVGREFECNICLEMASEPVVTCCGHLFCWPCLHQWLHVHSVTKKCPVCKGLLSDEAMIPIYGRGSSAAGVSSSWDRNIPPRPIARRVSRKRVHGEDSLHSGEVRSQQSAIGTTSGAIDESLDESTTTDVILERLRVARNLQQEYFERRSTRLAQRLIARQTSHIGSSSIPRTRELHQRARQTLETAADNLAAIQTSIDGLRENMQRLVEFVRSVPRYNTSAPVRTVANVLDEERAGDVREAPLHVMIMPTANSVGDLDEQSSSEIQENHGNSSASGSHNAESGSYKRCRLN